MMHALALVTLLLACKKDEEITYSQFNGDADQVTIQVGIDDVLDPVVADLTSSTGEVVVGQVEVDPGGGPLGTEHAIVVEIFNDWEQIVDRVSVRLQSPGRGEDEFELDQDSADEGVWKLTIVSTGTEGEEREDTLTVRAWDIDGDDDADGSSSGGDDTGG
ncbi:MAG: hypothetical protein H6742_08040 [Alphaproteobacteria bacterium]|nr:hypothetical protein [Alphaproteobacteria bacterium]